MKLLIVLIVLLTCYCPVYTQQVSVAALEDPSFDSDFARRPIPLVTGQLINFSPEDVPKATISYALVTLLGQVRKTAALAPDGSFRLELDYPLPYQQIWFSVGDFFYAGLYANKDLHVEVDIKKVKAAGGKVLFNGDAVNYSGTDGVLTTYLNDYVLFRRAEQQALLARLHQIPRSTHPEAAIVQTVYRPIFDSLKMIQDDYVARHPSAYDWLLENERLSQYYGMICVYYWGHAMENELFETIKKHKTYLISNNSTGFYRYLSTYFTSHPASKVTSDWKDAALASNLSETERAAADSLRFSETHSPTPPYTTANMQKWKKLLQPRIQQIWQLKTIDKCMHLLDSILPPARADLMKLQLNDSKDINEQQSALARILPGMQTNWCRQIALKEYEHTAGKIEIINKALASPGNTATASGFGKPLFQTDFGATLYTISNMKGTDFLANLRKSFPGKAIVFDLWATWCAPCLSAMPHSKMLQQSSQDLPVVFVYVCTIKDSNESRWKTKVAELKLPGIHFFIDEALDAELAQYFSFSGYPGYALIDQNGIYKAGVIKSITDVKDRAALADLLK
ncbi:MAG: TlpA family protein disulfide reductase [Chitinophagaceae bacterium]|nr:TlpA family protein disulfide reductase [Chitinophagaceae bacterium]